MWGSFSPYSRVWMTLPPPPLPPPHPHQGLDPALVSLLNFSLAVAVIQGPVIVYKTRIFFILIIRCWLSTENYYIWSFAAPVILITTVSTYQRLIPIVSWFRIHSTNIKSKQKNMLSIRAFIQPIYLRWYLKGSLSLYIASILSWNKPGGPKLLDRGASAQTKIFGRTWWGWYKDRSSLEKKSYQLINLYHVLVKCVTHVQHYIFL